MISLIASVVINLELLTALWKNKRDTKSHIAPQSHRQSTGEVFPQFETPGDQEETSIGHSLSNSTLSLTTN